jgi:hypothetical protein
MVDIARLADGSRAAQVHAPDLSRWQPDDGELTLFCHQLHRRPRTPRQLTAASHLQFHIVNCCAGRDAAQRQAITGPNWRIWAREHSIAYIQPRCGKDVPFLSILIGDQCNPSTSIRIVFDCLYRARNPYLITFEVYRSIAPFVSAAAVTHSELPSGVTAGLLLLALG